MYIAGIEISLTGLTDKGKALKEMPIHLFVMNTSIDAVGCLQEEQITAAVSRWELEDVGQQRLLRSVIAARPATPTIAFITPGDSSQEKAAKSLGVSVVLCNDIDNECFREILCQLSGIRAVVRIKAADGYIADINNPGYEANKFFLYTNSLSSSSLGLKLFTQTNNEPSTKTSAASP